jgi:UDP-GlcNAc3NAcA epimerase
MSAVVTVVGTRPEFIRSSVLSKAIRSRANGRIEEIVVNTGQHYDYGMAGVFFDELEIPPPSENLNVHSNDEGSQIGRMVSALERVLRRRRPRAVIVHGDTNSTLAGVLAGKSLSLPVYHVEAGLRSGDHEMVEEQNRIVADHLSARLYCPTAKAVQNLKQERLIDGIRLVGDLSVDACRIYYLERKDRHVPAMSEDSEKYAVLTIHRAENTRSRDRLESILSAVNRLDSMRVIFPVHPRTLKVLTEEGIRLAAHVEPVEPVGFIEMLRLIDGSVMVLTDSGGVQKEAYILRKPCITLRDSTEWSESVDTGWNRVVGTDTERIIDAVASTQTPGVHPPLYGNGTASVQIADDLLEDLCE